jgi:type I restriction-modification system DNA methylase subunit
MPQPPRTLDEYLAENMFWVPKKVRWSHLQANAKQPSIGKLIDEAMPAIEVANPGLKASCARTIIARPRQGDARRTDRPHPWPRLRIFPFTLCAG